MKGRPNEAGFATVVLHCRRDRGSRHLSHLVSHQHRVRQAEIVKPVSRSVFQKEEPSNFFENA
jgi:hypothetical protein